MSVIPLTLTISLCLVFTFVVFFLREHSRQRFSSAESDALLPLADEMPRVADSSRGSAARTRHQPNHTHANGKPCGCKTGEHPPCSGCLRPKDAASSPSA